MVVSTSSRGLGILRQYLAAVIAALSMLMTGIATAWPSPVLPMILNNTAPVAMDTSQISWMVSIMFLGNTLIPLPIGRFMDQFGRKRIMYVLNVLPFSAWVITYYASTPWHLYLARLFNGLWSGTSYTVCAIYIGEIAEPSIRGSLSNFNNLLRSVGGLYIFVIGPYVSFETLALLCGIVPSVFFVAAFFIPESPYFLLMQGRKQEAKEALRWLRGNKEEQALELELVSIEKAVVAQTQMKGTLKDIFTDRANRKAFAIAMIISFARNLSGYDVMMAYTSITLPPGAFESLGPNECVIVLGIIAVITCVASMFLMDTVPRRFLLTFSTLGCALTTLIAGCWFFLNDNNIINVQDFSQLPFYCFAVHSAMYSIGLGPMVASVKGEVFSASIKGLCSSILTLVFAVVSFVGTKIYLIVATSLGMYVNYFIYSVGCMVFTIFILVYVVETRGKTLQEIQIKLSEKKRKVGVSVIAQ